LLEAFAVPECDCYPIAERIQKIVLSFIILVADPKAFDLVSAVGSTPWALRDSNATPRLLSSSFNFLRTAEGAMRSLSAAAFTDFSRHATRKYRIDRSSS
jgi:hypothetical protein